KIDAGRAKFPATPVEPLGKLAIDNGIEDDSGLTIDRLEHGKQLPAVSDQRVDMLHCHGGLELRSDRPSRGNERFARGVRNEVQVKEVFFVLHAVLYPLLITRERAFEILPGPFGAGISLHVSTCGSQVKRSSHDLWKACMERRSSVMIETLIHNSQAVSVLLRS